MLTFIPPLNAYHETVSTRHDPFLEITSRLQPLGHLSKDIYPMDILALIFSPDIHPQVIYRHGPSPSGLEKCQFRLNFVGSFLSSCQGSNPYTHLTVEPICS